MAMPAATRRAGQHQHGALRRRRAPGRRPGRAGARGCRRASAPRPSRAPPGSAPPPPGRAAPRARAARPAPRPGGGPRPGRRRAGVTSLRMSTRPTSAPERSRTGEEECSIARPSTVSASCDRPRAWGRRGSPATRCRELLRVGEAPLDGARRGPRAAAGRRSGYRSSPRISAAARWRATAAPAGRSRCTPMRLDEMTPSSVWRLRRLRAASWWLRAVRAIWGASATQLVHAAPRHRALARAG